MSISFFFLWVLRSLPVTIPVDKCLEKKTNNEIPKWSAEIIIKCMHTEDAEEKLKAEHYLARSHLGLDVTKEDVVLHAPCVVCVVVN